MSISNLLRLIPESGSFLLREARDLRLIVGEDAEGLPLPQRIFLDDEEATPLMGFPVLLSESILSLRKALEAYVRAEEEVELSVITGRRLEKRPAEIAWDNYCQLLNQCMTNAVSSSFGRAYPSIFWLYHSIAVSRLFKEIPKHVLVTKAEVGRKFGIEIKYRIFSRYLDKVLDQTYEVVERAAAETEEMEDELFPRVLARMRDNILILTEDHIGPDLRELDGFFKTSLHLDGPNFRECLGRLVGWHIEKLEDPTYRGQIRGLLELEEIGNPWNLMVRPGYVTFLSRLPGYDQRSLLNDDQVDLWNQLLHRLKEYDLLATMRRYVIPLHETGGKFTCPGSAFRGAAHSSKEIVLSYTTRPLDFATPWVVDPLVRRFGLIYDITDFSSIVSILRRSGSGAQDLSFRRIFSFQRKVNKIARGYRLQLEKYLGDGALYSGRHPSLLLAASVRLQRHYKEVVQEDFPFDRGMRLALNYGQYRLLPIEGGGTAGQHRYEFFGHGIVELSRLVTGKSSQALEEIKNQLINHGYDPMAVESFFEPATHKHDTLVDRADDRRTFYASLNTTGTLVNEGIIATRDFMAEAAGDEVIRLRGLYQEGHRRYIAFEIADEIDVLQIGVRMLGKARLKGLENVQVFEVVDGEEWLDADILPCEDRDLLKALESEFRRALDQGDFPASPTIGTPRH